VESVLAQTFACWELIIVNDGSPDQTREIALNLIARHSTRKIRLLEKANGGLAEARNAGIRAAIGKYVLPLDADDRIAPTFLEKAVAVLESQTAVGFVYSHIQHFGLQDDLYPLPEFDAETMVYTDNVASVCALVRRSVWEAVGGYNTTMNPQGYEDWDFWVSCIEKGWQGHRLPEPLFFYRKSKGSMLGTANDQRDRLVAQIVLNHRSLYSPERVRQAELVLAGKPEAVKPRNILLACTHFWPSIGGLETVVENLGVRLVKRGYRVTVATTSRPDRRFPLYRGVHITSLTDQPATPDNPAEPGAQLRELVASGQYEACVLLADPLNWVLWSLENLRLPAFTRVIVQPIINADGYSQWRNNLDFRSRLSRLLKGVHAVVAMSRNGQEVKFFREEEIPFDYLPNAAEAAEGLINFRERHNVPRDCPMVLHVANLWPVKNHLGLMRALSLLPGDWQLVMIGHPSQDAAYLEQVRQAVDADRRFRLIPGLPHAETAAAMAAADVVLLASHGEVSPITILEAMAHGVPWLATPECGAVHDNAGGVVAPLEQFPNVLGNLMVHPEIARQLGRLGREHWDACHNWERVAAAWEEVILTGHAKDRFEMPPHVRAEMDTLLKKVASNEVALAHPGPKVSVILPTFNRPQMLVEALQSVLNQTYRDFEIIVVNDAGTDVRELIDLLNTEGKIRYLCHTRNKDRAAARNSALRVACGKYIAYLDDDDIFYPDHLETLVTLAESGGYEVVYSDAHRAVQRRDGERTWIAARDIPYSNDFDADRILIENLFPVLCILHERNCVDQIGLFDESLTSHEDWDYWIRLSRVFELVHHRKVTCEFRWREDGSTTTSSRRADFLRTAIMIYDKHQGCSAGKPEVLAGQRNLLKLLCGEVARLAH
jgi:glycosyltransferase involved in cell wall biosynthesis